MVSIFIDFSQYGISIYMILVTNKI